MINLYKILSGGWFRPDVCASIQIHILGGWTRRNTREATAAARGRERVSFHVLINSRVITHKLISQPLCSFNGANYDRHKCKHLIVVYTGARALHPPLGDALEPDPLSVGQTVANQYHNFAFYSPITVP